VQPHIIEHIERGGIAGSTRIDTGAKNPCVSFTHELPPSGLLSKVPLPLMAYRMLPSGVIVAARFGEKENVGAGVSPG
jgi:hypothetical protein